jgi:ABC-type nitrate/sulfonate/bicarbonate transport system substrate-binding protein
MFVRVLLACFVFAFLAARADAVRAATPLLVAYGGHNETMAPIWVGIEKGLFRKYGVDPRALQTRSGPIMMATLASGGVPLVWAAPSSAFNASVSGLKLTCFAAAPNLDAWRLFKRLLTRVNPKVQDADLEQIITGSVVQNLEASGFLPEMRKKLPR